MRASNWIFHGTHLEIHHGDVVLIWFKLKHAEREAAERPGKQMPSGYSDGIRCYSHG